MEQLDQRKGRPAEKHFSLLCSQANITCNKSEEDDHGWDFIVEVPMPVNVIQSADLTGEIRKCEVQVKASEKGIPVVKLSLSNARAFAKSRLPCFIVAVLDQNTPQPRVFIRHFWEKEIEQSLKRVRSAGNSGQALNKTFTQFTLSESEDRSPDPIEWLVKKVQSLPQNYSGEKMRIEQSVGYDEGSLKGVVRIGPIEGIEELVDHQLGLTESVPVEFVSLTETRFNIASPQAIFEGKPSFARMHSKAKKDCKLVLRSEEGDSMMVRATLTAPAIPNLPPEALKLRLETWFFNIVVSNGRKIDLDLSLDVEAPLSLRRLSQFVQFVSWSKAGPISFSIIGDGLPIAEGQMNLSKEQDLFSFFDLSKAISLLLEIAGRSGAEAPSIIPAALFRNWNKCAQFYNFVRTDGANLEVVLDRVIPSDILPQSLIGWVDLDLEMAAFAAILEFPVLSEERNGNNMRFSLGAPIVRDCYVGSDIGQVRALGDKRSAEFGSKTGKVLIEIGNLLEQSVSIPVQ